MKVSSVSEMRELDRTAVETFGIREELLMENAGEAVYSVLRSRVGIEGNRFAVCCGGGNNGGDGFVVARKIHSDGGEARVFVLGDRGRFTGAARLNLDILSRMPVEIREVSSASGIRSAVVHCDAVVDALFGTGLGRGVEGVFADVIDLINESGKPVFSVDIPSGVHGNTGQVMGRAVRAQATVTFGLPKIGNVLYPGYGLCGELYLSHISFPPALYEARELKVEINEPPPLPPRDRSGHKGSFGDVLFVAGARSYCGAPYFAALSFLKSGGGYSRLAAPLSITPLIAARGSEIVFVPMLETPSGSISLQNRASLLDLSEKVDMVVLGPGLSLEEEPRKLVLELVSQIGKPLLIDGDGITAVCDDLAVLRNRRGETVLTPHPGEMSRITGRSVSDMDACRVELLQGTAEDLGCHIVLKGAHSLIGHPDRRVFVNMSGNPGMATAGSGDVLTGTIAGMYGLGLPLGEAVRKGVFIHGLAGDLAAERIGEDGMTAQSILEALPLAVKMDRRGPDRECRDRWRGLKIV